MIFKLLHRSYLGFFLVIGLGGCALTATRPIQEMSNAEIALKAAKDLNADSLVPETYRNAVDNYFKAKRDYRLKNFDNAKKYALRATRLAEQAEFEAYRLGGAAPEAASKLVSPEGSSADPDASFNDSTADAPTPASHDPLPPAAEKPSGGPENKGVDYNVYLEQQRQEQEAERAKAEKEREKKEDKKPSGQTGPTNPVQIQVPAVTSFPAGVVPNVGAPPLNLDHAPSLINNPHDVPPDLTPTKGSDPPFVRLEPAVNPDSSIQTFDSSPGFAPLSTSAIPLMSTQGIPVKEGLDTLEAQPIKSLGNDNKDEK